MQIKPHQSYSNNHFANDTTTSTNIINPEIIHNKSIANGEYINCSWGKK